MKIVAVIPARGGSKGIIRKNVRSLSGKPLIAHSIEAAKNSTRIDRVIVSTDDEEIAQVAKQFGAEVVIRPENLAGDTASSESALSHVLDELENQYKYVPDLVVFLQCTSPIRSDGDLDSAIQLFLDSNLDSLLSVSSSHRFLWKQDGNRVSSINYDYKSRPRRQDLGEQFVENGSFYLFRPPILREFGNRLGGKIGLFVMPEECSWEIDSEIDFLVCESIMAVRNKQCI
jgi:CMP-N,N'-diacetyllegionaminic acid synthase